MFADIGGRSIHYSVAGTGARTLILVHGWGGTTRSLSQLSSCLCTKYRVISLDLPGFGASDHPEKNWGVEEYAGVVREFIRKTAAGPVIYFGHSFGGALGIYLAASHPELIAKLVLAAPSFHRSSVHRKQSPLERLPGPRFMKLIIRKLYYKLFYPRSDILAYPHLEENYRRIVATDLTPLISRVRQPALILWGELDRDTPVADARLLHRKLAGSTLVIYPRATHNVPLKNAEEVCREMEKFI